ncbi:MAG: DNA-formamidopyrimidine glycosylase family protein [Propionicimonas sp.]|uniref:Fpg/Nei family DNA glycosylase n=1 Tax=Propionicimonas sp. TaxID=1955623 RepID=UPI002B21E445|nr:DNA-formamidopyrimidine glycosylase family protein [Propionicimonas sp.]MEA4945215.1 DNA-formamidopyrimidine glycosylase family protein [Propionicimonas sp.]
MPELPEVEALRGFLERNSRGKVVAETHLLAFPSLKTFEVPLTALQGLEVTGVDRRGKFIGLDVDGLWLVFHLARAGWLTWRDEMPASLPRAGRGPVALRLVFDDGSGFDLTEAGTQKGLALYVVNHLQDVPGIAGLGPDPLADDFTPQVLAQVLATAGRSQLKRVLRDQHVLAGIGNAYSDEILHAARMSPFKPANGLDEAELTQLYEAIRGELTAAVERASGLAAQELKDTKRAAMRVHGRTGQACPVCGSTILEVSYADSSLQYCPGCQTGGKPLADRRLSRLLK